MSQFFVFVIIIAVCIFGYYAYNYYYDNLLFKKLDRRKDVKFSPEIITKLETLNEKLVNEGCNGFYIHKVNESNFAEGHWLEFRKNEWIVYFSERGQENLIFNNSDIEKALKFFYDLIILKDHWHLVVITFSIETFNCYKDNLERHGIIGVQNDMDNYRGSGEHAYRLFVKNKEIFKVKELFDEVPFFDYKHH